MIVLDVAVPVPLNKTFHYLPLEGVNPESIVGKRVKIPFGKRILIGYVVACLYIEEDSSLKLKQVMEVIDDDVLINSETIELADYISKNYICSLGEAYSSIIPVSMRAPKKISKKTKDVFELSYKKHILNAHQRNAVSAINASLDKNSYSVFLVHGVTASGKTEVYINAIEYALNQDKNAIMLIPEISLTPQFVDIMTRRFGSKIGVWHSGITNVEKYKLFHKAKAGEIKIMLGARSAIFAPFKKLGVIIIDEEHEHTYKQEQKPSYDAREIAKWRGKYHNAVVIFGSATPSLETYRDAQENKICLIELSERIDKKELPEVKIISLKERLFKTSLLLPETVDSISKALARKEQIIVFLNRRGYSPAIMCKKCSTVYQCPKCSISMVFHRNPDLVKCHYCGETKHLPLTCPVCKGRDVTVFGTGTQKVEDELKRLFKNAKIFRLDGDTASTKETYANAYTGVKNEEYDILLGTQMIAKGFDFPRVSLVCVIDADTSLYLPGFKSVERTFQLITQVAGRSGRGNIKGSVIVQTNNPTHYAIEHAKNHDFVSFYNIEIEQRKKMFYPPYCDVTKIVIRNKNEQKVDEDSENLFTFLKGLNDSYEVGLKLLGPVPAYIAKLNNTYRRHIIIKGERKKILHLVKFLESFKQSSGTFVGVEIMPSDLL
ncbi:primosomal protein N' [Candidatus Endomicrobiellum devescovinae]|jgi:primosomal protein N' (replication factor Y)|uniref:replication restart helicase PriA n=1 Tax=Candidatus Endomicrobiellum devescovinae TaxID=3242322 RepID=UPI002835E42D|nr:primosomal protein N' [Endomicrobium sp.]